MCFVVPSGAPDVSKQAPSEGWSLLALGYNLPYHENGRVRARWRVIVELFSAVGTKQAHGM